MLIYIHIIFLGLFKLPGGRPWRLGGFILLLLVDGATEATAVLDEVAVVAIVAALEEGIVFANWLT